MLLVGVGLILEDHLEAAKLGSITCFGAGAVRLHELDGLGTITCALVAAAQCLCLTFGHGRVDALGATIRGAPEPLNHCIDLVPIALCILEALERDHPDALAEHRPIGLIREGTAIAGDGQRGRLAKAHEHQDVVERIDATTDHQVRLPEVELIESDFERCQRGCTGGIDDAVGAAEIEAVRDATGDHVPEQPREGALLPLDIARGDLAAKRLHLLFGEADVAQRALPDRLLEATGHVPHQLGSRGHAEHDADLVAVHVREVTTGDILEDALCDIEREQLCGVRSRDDVWRDAKVHRRELRHGQESPSLRVGLVWRGGVRIVVIIEQPVCLGHFAQQVMTLEDVLPELALVNGARKESAGANNRDGGILRGHRCSLVGTCSTIYLSESLKAFLWTGGR